MSPKPGFWHYLLLLIPITTIAYWFHFPVVVTFILASSALVSLAHFLGEATEIISDKTGEHLSGIINATFGNAAELVIAVLAIKSGLIDIVKYSLIGSIIGNILLILGLSLFFGGIKFGNLKLSPLITGAPDDLPLTRAQRVHPRRHPRHMNGGLLVHLTGMLGFVHAWYVLGLRHRDGWIGYGARIHAARFNHLALTGTPLVLRGWTTSLRRGPERIVARYGFEFHQGKKLVSEADQTAVWSRLAP